MNLSVVSGLLASRSRRTKVRHTLSQRPQWRRTHHGRADAEQHGLLSILGSLPVSLSVRSFSGGGALCFGPRKGSYAATPGPGSAPGPWFGGAFHVAGVGAPATSIRRFTFTPAALRVLHNTTTICCSDPALNLIVRRCAGVAVGYQVGGLASLTPNPEIVAACLCLCPSAQGQDTDSACLPGERSRTL